MLQPQRGEELDSVIHTAELIFRANGFEVVTNDDKLFSRVRPSLAAIKYGRLLVCLARSFAATSQFLEPEAVSRIRDELDEVVATNSPEEDSRVTGVEKVALVVVPGDITIASPEGDIKWVVVEEPDELPEEMDKVIGWT